MFGRWMVACWLIAQPAALDPDANTSFETFLSQIIELAAIDPKQAWRRCESDMRRALEDGPSLRQRIRFWFHSGMYAMEALEYSAALDYFTHCETLFRELEPESQDAVTHLFLLSWLERAQVETQHYIATITSARQVIEYIEQGHPLSFTRGDLSSFHCYMKVVYAHALWGNDNLHQAHEIIVEALQLVEIWYKRQHHQAAAKPPHPLRSKGWDAPVIPPLTLLDQTKLHIDDPITENWLYLYVVTHLRYANILQWLYREGREEVLEPLTMCVLQLTRLAKNVPTYVPREPQLAPELHLQSAEILLLLLEKSDFTAPPAHSIHPLFIQDDWEVWRDRGAIVLDAGERAFAQLPKSLQDAHCALMYKLRLLRVEHAYLTALTTDEQPVDFHAMLGDAQAVRLAAEDAGFRQIAGEADMLMGKILAHMGESDAARDAYASALRVFYRGQGNRAFIQQVNWLLAQLPDSPPPAE